MPTIRAVDGGYLLGAEQFYYTKDEQRRPVMHIKGGIDDKYSVIVQKDGYTGTFQTITNDSDKTITIELEEETQG